MIVLVVGLPGAGKTTRAKELEATLPALRLTPDEWQQAVFAEDGPDGWRADVRAAHRDRIEGLLVTAGLRAARLGLHVVLDFGLWSRDERSALRRLAASIGVAAQVVYLPVDLEEQHRRVLQRQGREPGGFHLEAGELRRWHAQLDVPDQAELAGGPVPDVPPAYASWAAWAVERWPSLTLS